MLYCTVLRYVVVHICNLSIHPDVQSKDKSEKNSRENKTEWGIVVRSVVTVMVFVIRAKPTVDTRIVVKKESPPHAS